jgi:hypothetical protein
MDEDVGVVVVCVHGFTSLREDGLLVEGKWLGVTTEDQPDYLHDM